MQFVSNSCVGFNFKQRLLLTWVLFAMQDWLWMIRKRMKTTLNRQIVWPKLSNLVSLLFSATLSYLLGLVHSRMKICHGHHSRKYYENPIWTSYIMARKHRSKSDLITEGRVMILTRQITAYSLHGDSINRFCVMHKWVCPFTTVYFSKNISFCSADNNENNNGGYTENNNGHKLIPDILHYIIIKMNVSCNEMTYFDGFVQDYSISIALALETPQSCTAP